MNMVSKKQRKDELKRLYREGTIDIIAFQQKNAEIDLEEKPQHDNLGNKKAWVYQNKIVKTFETEGRPSIRDVKDKAMLLPDERYKALFIMLYLTAARISEVVGITNNKHIETVIKGSRPWLLIRLENRKNRERKFKEILIPLDYPLQEKELAYMLMHFLEQYGDETILFPMTKNAAYYYFKKYTGWNCHLIRHLRCTHLMTMYGIDPELLKKMAGWSDLRPAKYYINLVTDDLMEIFPKDDTQDRTMEDSK